MKRNHTGRSLLALLMALAMCLPLLPGMLPAAAADSEPCTQHVRTQQVVDEPTCVDYGYYIGVCAICGTPLDNGGSIDPLGHDFQEMITREPTCTEEGYAVETCTRCGAGKDNGHAIPALGHSWTEWSVINPATCTDEGLQVRNCIRCGIRETQPIPATGHSPVVIPGVPATCTTGGKTEGSQCSVCGMTLILQADLPPTGHTAVVIPAVPATCTEGGKTEGSQCSVCGAILNAQADTPALGHDYEATEYKEATASEDGYIKFVCTRCWDSYTEIIPRIPHEHNFVPVAGTPATCTEPGVNAYACTICGESYSESTPALGHIPTAVPGKMPTCTEPGLTEGSVCSRCGAVLAAQMAIPATGHNWGEWIVIKEATADTNGQAMRTCKNNTTHAEYYTIPATGKEVATGTLIVTKIAGDTNQPLAGAHLQLEGPDLVDQWVSTSEPHTVTGLTINEQYTLVETEAPEGYKKAESISFRVTDANPISMTMVDEKDEEDTEKHASLTLTWMYDCDHDQNPYPSDQDTFDGEDSVYAFGTWVNNGNVPLSVYAFAKIEGVYNYTYWYMGDFNPGESDYNGWGRMPIRDIINPGTETEELLGTVTVSWYVAGYDPDTYVNRDNPGPELCRSETITRTWKVRRPEEGPTTWQIPEESKLAVSLAQDGYFNNQADPSGYQLGEVWDTTITVQNIGPVDVDDITLRVDFIAAEESQTQSLIPYIGGTTYGSSWYEYGLGGIAAGKERDLWGCSPFGKFTAEDVARGYVYVIASVRWTDPDSGKEKTASSAPLYLPVISKTGLLLKKGIDHGPANDSYFQEGEAIPWTLTVTNNSKEPITNVTVTDQGVVVGTFAEIKPGETLPCSVPPHTVTEYEAKVVGTVTNMASATGTDLQGAVHTWPSNPCSVPTNQFSPTPLPKPDEKEKGKDGGDGTEDPLPPGTPETPETPGTPGGGEDPLGPEYGVTVGATVYKTTAHGPKNYEYYELGEPVDYTITVKNIGEIPIENLKLYDSLGGLLPVDTWPSLAPNEEHTFSFQWIVNQGNIDDGYVVNSATLTYTFLSVNGTPRISNPVYVLAGKDGHLPITGFTDIDKETPKVPHFPGLTGGGAPHTAPGGTYYMIGPDGKPIKTDATGKPILDGDGKPIVLSFSDADLCALEITGRSGSELRYTLHTCSEHQKAAAEAEKLSAGEAADLWRTEIDKLYDTLYEAADEETKALVMNDRIAYWAYIDAWNTRFYDEAALRDLLRLQCAELCCMIHTAPAAMPGSLTNAAAVLSTGDAAICGRTVDEANSEVVLTFDGDHRGALAETMELLGGSPDYAADSALARAQTSWATALDRNVNAVYKAADREARKPIAAWRQALDTLIAARKELLSALYENTPKVVSETVLNLYRDALIDACGHR